MNASTAIVKGEQIKAALPAAGPSVILSAFGVAVTLCVAEAIYAPVPLQSA
ncbi:hypothetical protein [Sodalis-like endosymbiont of Proechinophthirus fluctus]|uniref:hypothetical protein n=1 Tax=Sodalis-like endosymbiont of Proechinophthirus fluctus TaxID=1462730 RepID=UPI000A5CB2BC|nr:hypothetical protein [Sodalis-like endosymbiont of Proechinophthirus fluctus]